MLERTEDDDGDGQNLLTIYSPAIISIFSVAGCIGNDNFSVRLNLTVNERERVIVKHPQLICT